MEPTALVLAGSCANSVPIGEQMAEMLDLPFASVVTKKFPDSEMYVRVPMDNSRRVKTNQGLISIDGKRVIYVQTTAPNQSEHLIELFLTLYVLKSYKAKIDLVTPYLAHSRQDQEFKPGETVSVDAIGLILSEMGVDRLFTVDVHFDRRIGWFSRFEGIKGYNTSAAPSLCSYVKNQLGIREAVLVIPDEGNKPIYDSIKNVWGQDVIYLTKKRISEREVYIKGEKIDLKDKNIVIIDDMVSTGTTVLKTVEWLKKMGASKFTLVCTHALYLGNARTKLQEAGISNFVATDTIENPDAVIKIAPTVVDAIKKAPSESILVPSK